MEYVEQKRREGKEQSDKKKGRGKDEKLWECNGVFSQSSPKVESRGEEKKDGEILAKIVKDETRTWVREEEDRSAYLPQTCC